MFSLFRSIFSLALIVAAIGWYRGWFTLAGTENDPASNQLNVKVSVDEKKMKQDAWQVESKIAERIRDQSASAALPGNQVASQGNPIPAPGYPVPGYQPQGYSAPTYPTQTYPPQGYPAQSYPVQGYPPQGYPTPAYPVQGNTYQAPGYPAPVYPTASPR